MVIPADLIAFGVALLASLGITIPVRHFALRMGMVDKPGPRKVHVNPIPLLGGLAIYIGVILAVTVWYAVSAKHTFKGPVRTIDELDTEQSLPAIAESP